MLRLVFDARFSVKKKAVVMRPRLAMFIVCMSSAIASPLIAQQPFDIVIYGGRVADGSGSPWYLADVGIRDGKIAKIGRIDATSAKRAIDGTGLVIAPGFIDMMGQTATPMLEDPASGMNLLTQGITTINAGEGASAAPVSDDDAKR